MDTFYPDSSKYNNNYCICFSDEFELNDKVKNNDVFGGDNQFFSSKIDANLVFKNIYYKLNEFINSNIDIKITVLPDFFIDRIIQISDMDRLTEVIEKKIKVGGGSVRGLNSIDIKGGNAVNVAYCLARLGVKVDLFTVADKIGYSILNSVFKKFNSQVNLHIKNGKHGLTTIFEFTNPSFSVSNVMLSDIGDNCNFGPELIESTFDILPILNSSSAVVLTNWASNLRGTDLLKYVFTNSPNSLHFVDPADISERRLEFIHDLKNNSKLIDILSINENEFLQIICALLSTGDMVISDKENIHSITSINLCKFGLFLSRFFKIDLCIHTMIGSVLSTGRNAIFVNSIPPSKINIVSGAGDSWDSAFLFGHLLNFTIEEKLCFANLVAFLYLENFYNDFPSLQNIINYIYNNYF
ncbi:MAG: carbohydrate kinase family protein [Thermoproteota archaeon]|nr:carbohydrate kinase family protein [Thermoproteota archaeon]